MTGPGLETIEVDRKNWIEVVNSVREQTETDHPEWLCLQQYSVCPMSVASKSSKLFVHLYNVTGGDSRVMGLDEYLDSPAPFIEARSIIRNEADRIRAIQKDSDNGNKE